MDAGVAKIPVPANVSVFLLALHQEPLVKYLTDDTVGNQHDC